MPGLTSRPPEPGDEWTMICPPGCMDTAEAAADRMTENIREIVESPVAVDAFILVNDSALARYWAEAVASPVSFRAPPTGFDRYSSWGLVVNSPTALIRATGDI